MKTIKVITWEDIPSFYTGIVEYANGDKVWYLNGKIHREDGPAVECVDGHKEWRLNGDRHHVYGPAVEWANGNKEYWIYGELVPKEVQ